VSPATSSHVVRFLGLTELTRITDGEASFPLGILYPYTSDLRRVCRAYEAMSRGAPDTSVLEVGTTGRAPARREGALAPAEATFLASIATLHSRIAFAPGPAGASVAAAYRQVHDSLAPTTARRHP
jgi:hypothetical protein